MGRGKVEAMPEPVDLKALHAKIGELALENDFLEGALTKAGLLGAESDDGPPKRAFSDPAKRSY